jgi:hypothetical protein
MALNGPNMIESLEKDPQRRAEMTGDLNSRLGTAKK